MDKGKFLIWLQLQAEHTDTMFKYDPVKYYEAQQLLEKIKTAAERGDFD